ncbi:MAG: preprotein translocase subunit SecG [Alphaproteobacteria bacterium]|nr:preprotein translocase subunit SecG [Alphaproteobacteria bacterium]
MENVVLVIHLFLALSIIGLVLLQRSEGGGLGIGGGGGLGGLATPQGTASALTRMTAICAAGFFCTSLILGIMAGVDSKAGKSIMDSLDQTPPAIVAPAEIPPAPSEPVPETPTQPPAAPLAE